MDGVTINTEFHTTTHNITTRSESTGAGRRSWSSEREWSDYRSRARAFHTDRALRSPLPPTPPHPADRAVNGTATTTPAWSNESNASPSVYAISTPDQMHDPPTPDDTPPGKEVHRSTGKLRSAYERQSSYADSFVTARETMHSRASHYDHPTQTKNETGLSRGPIRSSSSTLSGLKVALGRFYLEAMSSGNTEGGASEREWHAPPLSHRPGGPDGRSAESPSLADERNRNVRSARGKVMVKVDELQESQDPAPGTTSRKPHPDQSSGSASRQSSIESMWQHVDAVNALGNDVRARASSITSTSTSRDSGSTFLGSPTTPRRALRHTGKALVTSSQTPSGSPGSPRGVYLHSSAADAQSPPLRHRKGAIPLRDEVDKSALVGAGDQAIAEASPGGSEETITTALKWSGPNDAAIAGKHAVTSEVARHSLPARFPATAWRDLMYSSEEDLMHFGFGTSTRSSHGGVEIPQGGRAFAVGHEAVHRPAAPVKIGARDPRRIRVSYEPIDSIQSSHGFLTPGQWMAPDTRGGIHGHTRHASLGHTSERSVTRHQTPFSEVSQLSADMPNAELNTATAMNIYTRHGDSVLLLHPEHRVSDRTLHFDAHTLSRLSRPVSPIASISSEDSFWINPRAAPRPPSSAMSFVPDDLPDFDPGPFAMNETAALPPRRPSLVTRAARRSSALLDSVLSWRKDVDTGNRRASWRPGSWWGGPAQTTPSTPAEKRKLVLIGNSLGIERSEVHASPDTGTTGRSRFRPLREWRWSKAEKEAERRREKLRELIR